MVQGCKLDGRILGVDPGTLLMGFGIIDQFQNNLDHVVSGVIRVKKSNNVGSRLIELYDNLNQIISEWQPSEIAIESPFIPEQNSFGVTNKGSVKSAIAIGQAQGVALMCASRNEIPYYLYAPTKVKSLVTGFGRSTKGEIADMVGILLKMNNLKNSLDATDALAVAICHSSVKTAEAVFTQ
ncbi:MAG: crossover junction endodeoxyribonuclease RuvC [Chloroflexi bacterium]|nr:crossover junction endodeoxyribonuclease RuvC [Chloroflexota bacterium]|tara:strand:+ start:10465 stop:11010 length:546 start_codon:yes stop_codon:yes gene_type:complete